MAKNPALALEGEEMLYIHDGILYTPLLVDGTLADTRLKHVWKGPDRKPTIITNQGSHYMRSVNLASLVENYESVNPASYRSIKNALMKKYSIDLPKLEQGYDDGDDSLLKTIIFDVMPHFVRIKKDLLDRTETTRAAIIDFIVNKERIPLNKYQRMANQEVDTEQLDELIGQLELLKKDSRFPRNGPITSEDLEKWVDEAVKNSIVSKEAKLSSSVHAAKEQLLKTELTERAVMLYLADKGELEIDRFGFKKENSNSYLVYARTGDYALKSRKGKIFHFRDCRVGVSVDSDYVDSPVVIDEYEHPFLSSDESMQNICIIDGIDGGETTAKNIIQNIEEGINTLFYGYTLEGRFYGYTPLDGDDPNMRYISYGRFSEYIIRKDDPLLKCGKLEIKNQSIDRI